MLNLIKKDISFNKKYIFYSLIYAIIAPILLVIDGGEKLYYLSLFLPLVALALIIGKACYLDDPINVRAFIKSLQISKNEQVTSKYLQVLFISLINFIYIVIIQAIFMKNTSIDMILRSNLLVTCAMLIYFSIYLALFFIKNYNAAQNSIYVIMCICFAIMMLFKDIKFDISIVNSNYFSITFSIISLISYILGIKISIKKME